MHTGAAANDLGSQGKVLYGHIPTTEVPFMVATAWNLKACIPMSRFHLSASHSVDRRLEIPSHKVGKNQPDGDGSRQYGTMAAEASSPFSISQIQSSMPMIFA